MDKELRDKMYEDLMELGIIDERENREDHTPLTLWIIMVDFCKSKEIF